MSSKVRPALRVAAYVIAVSAIGLGARAALHARQKHPTTVVSTTSPAVVAGAADHMPPPESGSLGPLDVGQMLPASDHEDAPGSDSSVLPRPERSLRLFVSPLDARGSMIRVYRRHGTVDELARELAPKARALGWTQVDSGETGTLDFERGTDLAIIRIVPAELGDKGDVVASLIEMPFRTPHEK